MQIDDPSVFPGQFGEPFPPNFMDVVRTMFKRLFRVYAHIYHSHFKQVCSLGEEAHLNTCFKHFIIFIKVGTRVGEKHCHLAQGAKLIGRSLPHPPQNPLPFPCRCLLLSASSQHFDLVEDKELAPLSELIEQFLAGKMNSLR